MTTAAGWQDISTAPEDLMVLVGRRGEYPRVAVLDPVGRWVMAEGQGGTVPYKPTHWCSLLELDSPPGAAAERAGEAVVWVGFLQRIQDIELTANDLAAAIRKLTPAPEEGYVRVPRTDLERLHRKLMNCEQIESHDVHVLGRCLIAAAEGKV